MQQFWTALFAILLFTASFFPGQISLADNHLPSGRVSDVRNTKHNLSVLSSSASRTVQADSESEICVFCHTPHGANLQQGPLWNRELSGAAYDTYNSGSLDATAEGVALNPPNGISKLCLSCHDGTIAIGAVRVLDGAWVGGSPTISMSGVQGDGTMPAGTGANTGFTRRIGTDLTNDHPISMTYDTALANADGEMRDPATEAHIGNRTPGNSPHVPLENGQVQCNSCHDPHIRDEADPGLSIKFLRLNRFQRVSPNNTSFNEANDIICLACHDKAGWVGSAHATSTVANETYTSQAASLRDFPDGTAVWESSCLACHDTHTVQGSRRLLREGTDGPIGPSGAKMGGNAAIEETCFACHSNDGGTLTSQGDGTEVPNIKSDFSLPRRMPISNSDQAAGEERHDIGTVQLDTDEIDQRGKDFIESRGRLGKASFGGSLMNRHAECTDCHNPHRVVRRRVFNESNLDGVDAAGTHDHDNTPHNNIASGVLRGAWGVEPSYSSNDFNANPEAVITFTIKRGDPSQVGSGSTNVNEPYVTREYQICLKCHSNYAYDTPPLLGSFSGGTPPGTNHMTRYTNQAQEYHSPTNHQGEGQGAGGLDVGADGGADPAYNNNNHRGWHPVMRSTGRNSFQRQADDNNWLAPFNAAVGTQTMYCTDCHGSNTPAGTVDPDGPGENGAVWGPHGSTNNFLLKGEWSGNVPNSAQNDNTGLEGTGENTESMDHLCFKCHDYAEYASTTGTGNSGFSGNSGMCGGGCMGGMGNSNNYHRFHISRVTNYRCNLCHVAVPHGWKNKNFLVNLNDVGPEGGFGGTGNQVRNGTETGYVNGPYYNRAALKVVNFAISGNWSPANCGSAGPPGNGDTGVAWMAGGGGGMGGGGADSEACANVP